MSRTISAIFVAVSICAFSCTDQNEPQPKEPASRSETKLRDPQPKRSAPKSFEERCYNRLTAFHDKFKALRKRKASKEEWDKLVKESQSMRQEFLPRLERDANAKRRDLQELLFALRDMVGFMLQDARTEVSESEMLFIKHLKDARKFLDRRIKGGGKRGHSAVLVPTPEKPECPLFCPSVFGQEYHEEYHQVCGIR